MGRVQVTAGLVMAVVGLVMILASVALAVFSDDSLPIPFAGVGLVFLAAGLSKHRTRTPSRRL
jgi:hypothetical protein